MLPHPVITQIHRPLKTHRTVDGIGRVIVMRSNFVTVGRNNTPDRVIIGATSQKPLEYYTRRLAGCLVLLIFTTVGTTLTLNRFKATTTHKKYVQEAVKDLTHGWVMDLVRTSELFQVDQNAPLPLKSKQRRR